MKFLASLILISLVFFTGTAVAQGVVTDPVASEVLRQIFDAITKGQWWVAAAAGVIGAVALARHYMPVSWKTGAKGDVVGVTSAFVFAFAGAVATWGVAPGADMNFGVIKTATLVGIVAAGGFNILHKLIGALVAWKRTPTWLVPALKIVAAFIGSNAVKKAEAAGDAAVAAAPAPGMTGGGVMREVD